MAELSGFWTTSATAVGDQQASYTQAHWSKAAEIIAACSGFEGVAPAYLNELSATATAANEVTVDTGGAMVDGKWYYLDVAATAEIPSAVGAGNTRIDRLVLRADWANFNVSLHTVTGTDAASPTAPSITQTSGTTYDILLWQALVDEAGAVTLTDERTFARESIPALSVLGNSATAEGIMSAISATAEFLVLRSTSGMANLTFASVNASCIDNRTRKVFLPALPSNISGPDYDANSLGLDLAFSETNRGAAFFCVPSDFASGLTISALVIASATGDAYLYSRSMYGATGESYNTHSATADYSAVALEASIFTLVKTLTLSDAAAGDYGMVYLIRDANNENDTNLGSVFLMGFVLSYTADS